MSCCGLFGFGKKRRNVHNSESMDTFNPDITSKPPQKILLTIKTELEPEEIQHLEHTPRKDERKTFKQQCPICFNYQNQILTTNCCIHYLCQQCCVALKNKEEKNENFRSSCPHCCQSELDVHDVDLTAPIRQQTDTPLVSLSNTMYPTDDGTNTAKTLSPLKSPHIGANEAFNPRNIGRMTSSYRKATSQHKNYSQDCTPGHERVSSLQVNSRENAISSELNDHDFLIMQVQEKLNDFNAFSENTKSDDEGEMSDHSCASNGKPIKSNWLKMRTAPNGFGVDNSAAKSKSIREQPAIRQRQQLMQADGVITDVNHQDVEALNAYIHLRPRTESKSRRVDPFRHVSASVNLTRKNSTDNLADLDQENEDDLMSTTKFKRINSIDADNMPPVPKSIRHKKRGVKGKKDKNLKFENVMSMTDDEQDLNDRVQYSVEHAKIPIDYQCDNNLLQLNHSDKLKIMQNKRSEELQEFREDQIDYGQNHQHDSPTVDLSNAFSKTMPNFIHSEHTAIVTHIDSENVNNDIQQITMYE